MGKGGSGALGALWEPPSRPHFLSPVTALGLPSQAWVFSLSLAGDLQSTHKAWVPSSRAGPAGPPPPRFLDTWRDYGAHTGRSADPGPADAL